MTAQMDKALDLINKMAADLGIFGSGRNKSSLLYYEPPKDWPGTIYIFGYTPWKATDPETGKEGFFALKYRRLKSGKLKGAEKLVQSVRFGRRKIASARALKWHQKYYGQDVGDVIE